MPIELNRRRLEEIVRALGDRLDGEWVLLGGALTAIWLAPRRVTEDESLNQRRLTLAASLVQSSL